MSTQVYAKTMALLGRTHVQTLRCACNLVISLLDFDDRYNEAETLLREQIPLAQQSIGCDHSITLKLESSLVNALHWDPARTRGDLIQAERLCQDVLKRRRRVFGPANPTTQYSEQQLAEVREKLYPRVTE